MAIRPSFAANSNGNPYRTSILDAAPPAWDFRAQSALSGRQTQESAWDSNAANAANAAKAASAQDDWQKAQRDKITALTEGRAGELANDPRMNQAMDFFGSVLNGSKLPFSEETQRAQLNQQANGTAAANAAQLRALEEAIVAQGGSLNDPSFQAKKQEMMSQRQGQNLDALGRMLSQAGTANFNAQAQGATSLAGMRQGQNAQINQMDLAGANFRAQDFRDVNTGGADNGGYSTFTTSTLGGGGNQAPAINPASAFSPQAPYAASTPSVRPPAPAAPPQTHTLQTGNTWGGQPYGGAPSAPAAPRPPTTGTGYVTMPGLSVTAQPYGPPIPKATTFGNPFGSPFMRPLGPNQQF